MLKINNLNAKIQAKSILNGFNLEDKCYSIMNDSPSYALEDEQIKLDNIQLIILSVTRTICYDTEVNKIIK